MNTESRYSAILTVSSSRVPWASFTCALIRSLSEAGMNSDPMTLIRSNEEANTTVEIPITSHRWPTAQERIRS